MANRDKRTMIFPVRRLADLGFEILATEGTALALRRHGVQARVVRKHSEGPGPDGEPTIVQRIHNGEVDLIVNTPFGGPGQSGPRLDGYEIRTAAVARGVPSVTTVQGLSAAVQAIESLVNGRIQVRSLQSTPSGCATHRRRPRRVDRCPSGRAGIPVPEGQPVAEQWDSERPGSGVSPRAPSRPVTTTSGKRSKRWWRPGGDPLSE